MATDFAPYANLRILWSPPAPIEDLRSGIPAATTQVVIEAFVRGSGPSPQELPSTRIGTLTLEGYITRYATVAQASDWLAAGSSLSWTDTGLMPDGLRAESRGRAFLGSLPDLPTVSPGGLIGEATITELAAPFGVGGIGAELRDESGDKIRVQFATVS